MIRSILLYTLSIMLGHGFCFMENKVNPMYDETQPGEGRILWGNLGDLIEATPFLPITINVPDIIYGIGDFMNGMYQYMFGSGENEEGGSSTPRIYLHILEEIFHML